MRKQAYERATLARRGAGRMLSSAQKTLDVPAIKGIGGSLLYFVDRYGAKGSAYDPEFEWLGANDPRPAGRRPVSIIDHLTHNVHRGRMDVWTGFYESCSTSARSASSTSRAAPPACSRAR